MILILIILMFVKIGKMIVTNCSKQFWPNFWTISFRPIFWSISFRPTRFRLLFSFRLHISEMCSFAQKKFAYKCDLFLIFQKIDIFLSSFYCMSLNCDFFFRLNMINCKSSFGWLEIIFSHFCHVVLKKMLTIVLNSLIQTLKNYYGRIKVSNVIFYW